MNLLNKKDYSSQKNRLLKAFPTSLINDVETVLEIIPFSENKVKLDDGNFHSLSDLIHPSAFEVTLNAETLIIPVRVYFNEPDINDESNLSEIQKVILNCIFLLHHNGRIRQKRLENLGNKSEYLITPFTINLYGEYVYEVIEALNKIIDNGNIQNYRKFVIENPEMWQRMSNRMVSYWNEYYRRRFPKLKEYIGMEIKNKILKSVA